MRRFNVLAFDDVIMGTGAVYSPTGLNELFGSCDQMSLHVVADQASGATTLTVNIEHSADQRNWIQKNPTASEVSVGLTAGTTISTSGSDAGTAPLLGFVRFKLALSAAGSNAHVKLWVTGRDQGA